MTKTPVAGRSKSEARRHEKRRFRSSGRRASEWPGRLCTGATRLVAVVLALMSATAMLWIGAPPAFASSPYGDRRHREFRVFRGRPARDGDGDIPSQSHLGQVRRDLGDGLDTPAEARSSSTSMTVRDGPDTGTRFWPRHTATVPSNEI
jgi:hypothetical protein